MQSESDPNDTLQKHRYPICRCSARSSIENSTKQEMRLLRAAGRRRPLSQTTASDLGKLELNN